MSSSLPFYFCSALFFAQEFCPSAPDQPGQCIWKQSLCDGFPECASGSDEDPEFCKSFTCGEGTIKCPGNENYTCTYATFCDGYGQCPVNADGVAGDEDPAFCKSYTCPDGFWKCGDGLQCVSKYSLCNGSKDCNGQ